MVSSVWKLLLFNTLLLAAAMYLFIFTDHRQNQELYTTHAILNGLMIYLILFPCLQALIHLTNLYICRSQLELYKMQMAEIISEQDCIAYIEKPLRKIHVLLLFYPLVLLAHAVIVFTCYYLKEHLL